MDLLVFVSHPIQHYVPWFAALHERLGGRMEVVFASRHGLDVSVDPEFAQAFAWEMDLLAGYAHAFHPGAGASAGPAAGFRGIRFPGVGRLLAERRPRAVLVFGWLYAGYWEVALAAARLGIPYFIRAESNLLNRGSPAKWWLKQRTVGRLCRGAACCLAIGTRNAELYRAYGVREERIRLAPYFVDNEHFGREADRLAAQRTAIRARLGLPAQATVFLFMGKLIDKKHPDHLLAAWRGLPEPQRARSALLFGGSGERRGALEAAAAGDARVVFAGFLNRTELPAAYAASDVLVLPSDEGETWGLVVNEAMASGRPAIVSDRVGCAPDLVLDGRTGHAYPSGDIAALRARLATYLDDADAAARLGQVARAHVRMASVQQATDAVMAALESL